MTANKNNNSNLDIARAIIRDTCFVLWQQKYR